MAQAGRQTKSSKPVAKVQRKFSQTPDGKLLNMLIDEYVQFKSEGKEVTGTLAKINDVYKKLTDREKSEFINMIYTPAAEAYSQEQYDKTAALAELFDFFATGDESKYDDILFWLGDIASMYPFDAEQIEKSIDGLSAFNHKPGNKERISTLKEYLENIRNYVPLSESVEGYWVSDLVDEWGTPWLILRCTPQAVGSSTIQVMPYCGFAQKSGTKGGFMQKVEDNGLNSIYTCYCSDDLTNLAPVYKAMIQGGSYFVANTITQKASNALGSSFGGQFASAMFSGVVGLGVDAALDAMLTPKKRIHIIELSFSKTNENVMYGKSHYRYVYIKGDEQPNIKDTDNDILFYRWTPESGVAFAYEPISENIRLIGYGETTIPSGKEMKRRISDKTWNLYSDYVVLDEYGAYGGRSRLYNLLQLKKLFYLTDSEAIANNWELPARIAQQNKVPYLGVFYEDVTASEKLSKKYPNQQGVYVISVEKDSPAQLFKLKEHDIIVAANGEEISNKQQFAEFISARKPYDQAVLSVLRNGKTFNLPVVFSYIVK